MLRLPGFYHRKGEPELVALESVDAKEGPKAARGYTRKEILKAFSGTDASMLINSGCPLVYVANQLGHTDTRMVELHYGHINDSAKRAAILAAMPTLGIFEPTKVKKLRIKGA